MLEAARSSAASKTQRWPRLTRLAVIVEIAR